MVRWRPTSMVFIIALSIFFGILTIHGTDVVLGTTVSGHISIDTTWDLSGSPYIVMNDVVVDPGVTLTIEPGVEVKFDPPGLNDYLSIYIEGFMYSVGAIGQPITFTSNSPTPEVWDWQQVQINSSGHAEIEFSIFEYGLNEVSIYSPNNAVTNSHFSYGNIGINLGGSSSTNFIANNTASNIGLFLWMEATSSNTIENNTVTNTVAPIMMFGSTHNLVQSNIIENSTSGIILQAYSGNNTIVNNTITNATNKAIRLGEAWKTVVENNTITTSGIGIEVSVVPRNPYLTIANNTITHCNTGIWAEMGLKFGLILGNRIEHNTNGLYLGFNVKFDSNSTIKQNEITFNSVYGMLLENVSGTLVYHNNFINNAIQALNDNGTNFWDNGYPSGGNYWSDYNGPDNKSGPNQNLPGSDGIGDLPYPINWSTMDRYPLTEPTTGILPPRNVNAHLTGLNLENVTVTWDISWNDGQRVNDVTGYEIYRSSVYEEEKTGYSLVGSTPNQTIQHVDSLSGEGNPNNYFYYVCAINGTGNCSCNSNQAGKFTHPLSKGPNLISIPLIQSDETIQTVLQTVTYDNAWSYDSINREWKYFSKSKPYAQSLEYLNHTMGIWVDVTQDSNLTVAGVVPTSTMIDLQAGWNLVGFPSFDDNHKVAELKTAVMVENIEGFDILSPPYYLKHLTDTDILSPGHGFWIEVKTDTTWRVEN